MLNKIKQLFRKLMDFIFGTEKAAYLNYFEQQKAVPKKIRSTKKIKKKAKKVTKKKARK